MMDNGDDSQAERNLADEFRATTTAREENEANEASEEQGREATYDMTIASGVDQFIADAKNLTDGKSIIEFAERMGSSGNAWGHGRIMCRILRKMLELKILPEGTDCKWSSYARTAKPKSEIIGKVSAVTDLNHLTIIKQANGSTSVRFSMLLYVANLV